MAGIEKTLEYVARDVHGFAEFKALKDRVLFEASELSIRQKNMIAAVVSRINGSRICALDHATAAARLAKDPGLYEALVRDFHGANVNEPDRAMLEYVAKLTASPASIASGDIRALRRHGFSDTAIVEMVMTATVMGVVNQLRLGTLGTVSADMAAEAARLGM